MKIDEVKRHQLIAQSRNDPRYKRRLKCRFLNASKSYDNINMNKLFAEDVLEAVIPVIGETDNYEVIISFSGFLDELRIQLEKRKKLDTVTIIRALVSAFDKNDVYIHCNCPDHTFRFNFWATIDRYNSGEKEMRPTHITNPDGDKGSTCKHGLAVLNRQTWIIKLASVINNYIKYIKIKMTRLYDKFIQPAIFGQKSEDDFDTQMNVIDGQVSMLDDNNLEVKHGSDDTTTDDEV